MTATRPMLHPALIADAPPTWLAALYGAVPGGFLAVLSFVLTRQGKNADDRTSQNRKQQEGASAVETENIRSLNDVQKRLMALNTTLSAQIDAVRAEGNQRALTLERKLGILTSAYYQLHSATVLIQQGWRTMRARLKRIDKEFDENEFPDLSIDKLDPLKLFAQMDRTTNVTIVSSPGDPGKTTTITTDEPADKDA